MLIESVLIKYLAKSPIFTLDNYYLLNDLFGELFRIQESELNILIM